MNVNGAKLKIFTYGFCIILAVLGLTAAKGVAGTTLIADTVEALDGEELGMENKCNTAGGVCYLKRNHMIHGISFYEEK